MSTNPSPYRRIRLILDCALVLLVILMAGAIFLPGQAGYVANYATRDALASAGLPFSNQGMASAQSAQALPDLDNNTLAAMIAAENAALTPPIHFIELPLLVR
jgi:hypothetical protein